MPLAACQVVEKTRLAEELPWMTIHPIFFFLRIPVSQFTSDIHV